jgi:hypothetical protein
MRATSYWLRWLGKDGIDNPTPNEAPNHTQPDEEDEQVNSPLSDPPFGGHSQRFATFIEKNTDERWFYLLSIRFYRLGMHLQLS